MSLVINMPTVYVDEEAGELIMKIFQVHTMSHDRGTIYTEYVSQDLYKDADEVARIWSIIPDRIDVQVTEETVTIGFTGGDY